MDVLEIARWQFGIITVYHFLFVPLTIGLTLLVAVMETAWLRTKNPDWLRLTKFFGKLMLINFAIGVVTGIVQEFQFGMNWSDYSRFVGDIFGAPLAIEALLAFFLESTFLGLWIFGWDKLPRGLHVACMWIVHVGTLASSWFILAANSWMQHPVGYEFNPDSGRAELTDFWAVMVNKVQLGTFPHVIGACYMAGAAFMMGIATWLYLRERRQAAAVSEAEDAAASVESESVESVDTVEEAASDAPMYRRAIRLSAWVMAISGISLIVSGDIQGKIMTEVQPMKMAAAEALYETSEECAPFSVLTIGTRDGTEEKWALEVPCLLSFVATGSFDGKVHGINDLREEYKETYGSDPGAAYYSLDEYVPNIPITYWTFRWMMGFGALAALIAIGILWLTRKGRTPDGNLGRWTGRAAIAMPLFTLAGIAVGWIFTEMGRQPWVVFGLQTTANGVSPGVSVGEAATSVIALTVLYGVLAVVEVGLLVRVVKKGPEPFVEPPDPRLTGSDRDDDEPLTFAY